MTQTAAQGRDYQGVSIPPAGTYELDRVHTVVGFLARHMLSKVRGQFTEFTGTIQVGDSPEDSRVEVEVQTQTITTHTDKRDQHLRNGDFLDVEQHPVLRFTSTAVRPTGGSRFELEGELTIKGNTHPLQAQGSVSGPSVGLDGSQRLGLTLETTVDRTLYGLNWNAPLPKGGFALANDVTLIVELELALEEG